jgi:hypothetical protein
MPAGNDAVIRPPSGVCYRSQRRHPATTAAAFLARPAALSAHWSPQYGCAAGLVTPVPLTTDNGTDRHAPVAAVRLTSSCRPI